MSDPIPTPEDPIKTVAGETAKEVIHVAAAVAPFIPVAFLPTVLSLIDKYGPGIIDGIENLFLKPEFSIAEVRAIFAEVRPYESFGIPDVVPPPAPES